MKEEDDGEEGGGGGEEEGIGRRKWKRKGVEGGGWGCRTKKRIGRRWG